MKSNFVSLEMALRWQEEHVNHTSKQYFAKANLWRDILPMAMADGFSSPQAGEEVSANVTAGELFEPYDKKNVMRIQSSQFNSQPRPGFKIIPRTGRFYPRNFVRNQVGITAEDRRPMRILSAGEQSIDIDLNMPLSMYDVCVSVRIDELLPPAQEHGGRCNDFVYEMLKSGVGMQTRMASADTDFFSGDPFSRVDESNDAVFYAKPRLVHHLDSKARELIENIYKNHIRSRYRVLDLMSSWVSHLPNNSEVHVTGLGLNEEELKQNGMLDQYVVHDLNKSPILNFADNSFDLVICTASVEYLVKPFEVFKEVARCLKPGGEFVLTFSDRWFPPKAMQLWTELHPFERVALIVQYFVRSGMYQDIETLSIQHYPRPNDDKYSNQLMYSDPVYAIWATVGK